MYSDTHSIFADMLFSAAAVTAMTTSQMAFSGNSFANFKVGYSCAHFFNVPHVLMTNYHWNPDSFLRPCVPLINMQIGTADCRFLNFYDNIIKPRFRNRNFLHPQTFLRSGFYKSFHLLHKGVIFNKALKNSPMLLN